MYIANSRSILRLGGGGEGGGGLSSDKLMSEVLIFRYCILLCYENNSSFKVVGTSASDATSLQKDLDHLAAWEKKWQMEFHPQKCSVLRITRNKSTKIFQYRLHGHILEPETNSKYLGVTINNKLSWNKHIDNITKKANGSIAFLRRNLQISQEHIKIKAYTTLVRP